MTQSTGNVAILGAGSEATKLILTEEAVNFLANIHRSFEPTRRKLLKLREQRQIETDQGRLPDFLPETKHIRDDNNWKGAAPAPGLVDRRVEITGPTDRKMVVNALNSDVWAYMADFEGMLIETTLRLRCVTYSLQTQMDLPGTTWFRAKQTYTMPSVVRSISS